VDIAIVLGRLKEGEHDSAPHSEQHTRQHPQVARLGRVASPQVAALQRLQAENKKTLG
jgi:hypothetical protein